MNLGIEGKHAIVCASSRGLGKACAIALAREGTNVVINGRTLDSLQQTADEINSLNAGSVTAVQADINTDEGRSKLIDASPVVDILVNNNEGPPPGRFMDWTKTDYLQAIEANLLAPVMMIKGVVAGMQRRNFGRIVNITSAMVKSPHAAMGLSTTARSGLTALCKGLSVEVAKSNVTINNMLPERFDTDRQQHVAQVVMRLRNITYEQARQEMIDSIAAKRLGVASEFGDACAYLCSAQAGFISGQNLQLDGGSYSGLI